MKKQIYQIILMAFIVPVQLFATKIKTQDNYHGGYSDLAWAVMYKNEGLAKRLIQFGASVEDAVNRFEADISANLSRGNSETEIVKLANAGIRKQISNLKKWEIEVNSNI